MDRMKITNRAMAIALNRSLSCFIEVNKGRIFYKDCGKPPQCCNQRACILDHGRYTNWREWGVFDYMFDMFEQVNGAQSTLESG